MSELLLNGKRAVRVNAKHVTWGVTDKSKLWDIDGDKKWVPNSVCKFEPSPQKFTEGTLLIYEWFYNNLFK